MPLLEAPFLSQWFLMVRTKAMSRNVKEGAVDRQTLDHQDKFFAMILSEGIPGVPDALEAAYIERLEKDPESSRYTAFAATLRGGVLHLHRLLSEGYGRLDGEKRHIKTTAIPLREVRKVDIETEVPGSGLKHSGEPSTCTSRSRIGRLRFNFP